MHKVRSGKIKIKDIKHIENSRLREQDDVSDLMYDIENRGLLEPIGIRENDKALIFGNRRTKAYEKLGYEEIECDFFTDLSDEDLLITNLAENIKRRNIGSIEIGRICKMLLEKNMTAQEIAVKLGLNLGRVKSSVASYNVTVNTPFEKLVVFNKLNRKEGRGIPESLIWNIQNQVGRALHKKITKAQWDILLTAAEQGKLTIKSVSLLRQILAFNKDISLEQALEMLDKTKIIWTPVVVIENEWMKEMRKTKTSSDIELMKIIFDKYNSDLLF